MLFPLVTCLTAGLLLLMQLVLSTLVTIKRMRSHIFLGDGNKDDLQHLVRRHGNLAENAAIFTIGFLLLELSQLAPQLLLVLCPTFILVRLSHIIGLSYKETRNVFRMIGAVGTYLIGYILAGTLIWIGSTIIVMVASQ